MKIANRFNTMANIFLTISIIKLVLLVIYIIKISSLTDFNYSTILTALNNLPIIEFLLYRFFSDLSDWCLVISKGYDTNISTHNVHYKKIQNNTTEINKLKAEIKELKALLPKKEDKEE